MFSKIPNLLSYSNDTLTIVQLYDTVRNNPQIKLIESIRSCEYKSERYNTLKLKVNCILPHGVFSTLRNDGLVSMSGYLYYDIDGFDTKMTLNDTIQSLKDTGYVCFIQKSSGGMGISFLVRVDMEEGMTKTNFLDIYKCVRWRLINEGFDIDTAASGLVRKMIISSDEDVYLNTHNTYKLSKTDIQIYKESNKGKTRGVKKVKDITPNDTLSEETIPFEVLIKQIRIETLYTKEIDGDFVIEDMNYYRLLIPQVIKDGSKHKLYSRVVNALYYINPDITKNQVYAYLYHINSMARPQMDNNTLRKLVKFLCDKIEETGEVYIKPRIKRIHFQKNSNLTIKQKKSMGAQISAKIKVNKTLDMIAQARQDCYKENIPPTQKMIQELTGLGMATIKRNWNKNHQNLGDIQIPDVVDVDTMRVITMDQFLSDDY